MKGAGIAVLAVVVAAVVVTFGKRDAGDFPAKELERHISHLAADDLGGRDTGEDGIRRAEEHIAATFADAGLKPLPGEDDFFVAMDLYRPGLDREATSLTITASDAVTGGLGRNYRPFPFTDEGELESEIVFAGYGITAEDAEWDDYADLDVDGKWVLVLRHTPHEGDQTHYFNQDGGGGHATFTTKAQLAARNGASGMLLVTDPLHHEDRDDFRADRRLLLDLPAEEDTPDTTAEEDPFLAIHISRSLAERLVSRTGRSLTELQSALDDGSTRAGEISLAGARSRRGSLVRRGLDGGRT